MKTLSSLKNVKPNYARHTTISYGGNGAFLIDDIRDFTWTAENSTQIQNWISGTYHPDDIVGAYFLNEPFGPGNLVAHSMLSFHFVDGRTLCLSVEAVLEEDDEYSFLKAMFLGYHINYVWGTECDHTSLRTKLRGSTVFLYPLHLPLHDIQGIFASLLHKTNYIARHTVLYSLITNNCTTALWNGIHQYFGIKGWNISLLFARFLPAYLEKTGVVKMDEVKIAV